MSADAHLFWSGAVAFTAFMVGMVFLAGTDSAGMSHNELRAY